MAAILPIAAVLLYIFFLAKKISFREATIKTYLIGFLLIFLSTEILSLFHAISYLAICIIWAGAFVLAIAAIIAQKIYPWKTIKAILQSIKTYTLWEQLIFLIVLFIVCVTLLIAIVSPPNTWDSMVYHMPKVEHWIQNGHVGFYPTSIERQNYQMPLAEFAILHLQILARGDRFANLIQWSSFVFCIIIATLFARQWKATLQIQLLAGLIAATTPMAIIQASSTQNDLVASAFCCSFAYFLLKSSQKITIEDAIYCTISFGLALVTKGTAYIYCAAIGLVFGIYALWHASSYKVKAQILVVLTLICAVGLSFSIPHYSRSYQTYQTLLSSGPEKYTNEEMALSTLVSNTLRNSALHLVTPWRWYNHQLQNIVVYCLKDAASDPKTTWYGIHFELTYCRSEDTSGNFIQFILYLIALIVVWKVTSVHSSLLIIHTIMLIISAMLFCLLLRWQPWHSRLHTPLFMLAAPMMGVILDTWKRPAQIIFILLLCLYSLLYLLRLPNRPLLPCDKVSIISQNRDLLYFQNRPELYQEYQAVTQIIRNNTSVEIGFCMNVDDWEYPLWVFVNKAGQNCTYIFRHILVDNPTAQLQASPKPLPKMIISTRLGLVLDKIQGYANYTCIFSGKNLQVWQAND